MPLTENAAPILALALSDLLGPALPGSMAFIRCLPGEVARELAADERFAVRGWQIAVVSQAADEATRSTTADKAVEWREDKAEAVLLLVDVVHAGAGMDGIYSAAREIAESELFARAKALARDKLPRGGKSFADKALSKARLLARNKALSPWREFAYLCRAAQSLEGLGAALPEIGLWPVAVEDKPDDRDLDKCVLLVERLLARQGNRRSAEARVVGLQLPAADAAVERDLAEFLRATDSLSRLDTLARLETREAFWLNRLRPGLFDSETLQSIRWVNWRQKNAKPYQWSGLAVDADNRLTFKLALTDNPQQRVRLEVRWEAEPATLAKGAADYLVEVRAGGDALAEKTVTHAARGPQKCVFTQDDFGDLEGSERFEAEVVIRALTAEALLTDDAEENPYCAKSEDFILCFGATNQPAKSSAGNVFPSLALAAIHVAKDAETFKRLADNPGDKQVFSADRKGYIACRVDGKAARVLCPNLLLDLAADWAVHQGDPGRWQLKVRADGSPDGKPAFLPFGPAGDKAGERFVKASRDFCNWLLRSSLGPLAVLYTDRPVFNEYVNAATAWWETTSARATQIHTLEVVGVSDQRIGLIVLPTHPLRVAWQQAFDMLVWRHRYEEGAPPAKVAKLLGALIGAHYPAMLPGFAQGEAFVFADSLGFHAVAMTATDDPEPKATVALLSRLLGEGDAKSEELLAPSVGRSASELLGEEVARYLNLHPETRRVHVHALRPGDAMPAARALGCALRDVEATEVDEEGEARDEGVKRAFVLDLYPANGRTSMLGRFLAATAQRRRSGAGVVPEEDRWLLDSVTRPGGASLPRLAWARRDGEIPSTPAHLALAFDIFTTRVECVPRTSVPNGALEVHGLALTPDRRFEAAPIPRWLSSIPPAPEGEKHPVARGFSERLAKAHFALLCGVAKRMGAGDNDWPVLITEVSPDRGDVLAALHRLCDWVVTVDRHAGVEYFDSPRDLPRLYEAYLIDCVPERDDLGFLQLITSTSSLDEIVRLLDAALGEMGLSASPRNCGFLLDALKAVSGRLALRLTQSGSVAQEMVALALTQSHCAVAGEEGAPWFSLKDGFFVPLDDVPELFRPVGESKDRDASGQRADLLYVTAARRGGLKFSFVEVKFRRYLKTARALDLLDIIDSQLDASCQRWEKLFGPDTTLLEKTVQRTRLARVLRFYARKGQRHTLTDEAFECIDRELAKLAREGTGYGLPAVLEQERAKVGFVFCPEYGGAKPVEIGKDIWLFGPVRLPETQPGAMFLGQGVGLLETVVAVPVTVQAQAPAVDLLAQQDRSPTVEEDPVNPVAAVPKTVELLLGQRDGSEEPVRWRVSIQGNPHLLIVGLPGMGKTTCLIQLCRQLMTGGIAPIVFSYHEDIDEKLSDLWGDALRKVSYAGLGFNPLQVVGDAPLAYMDNVTLLRDNFAAIFPDLGDVQLGRVREAIKQSYADRGWALGALGEIPPFGAFYDLLKAEAKPDRGLMTRLAELADYGLFAATVGAPSLLDSATPALVQVHSSQNEVLQRAFSTFVLHNLYQSMFRRGTQDRITHAVIFDEAHRAARLKLIPTMAKECRKYGLSFVVASQEAKDFDSSLFTAVANYLALRVSEPDAKLMAKIFAPSDKLTLYTDRIKQMAKFKAWFYSEGMRAPMPVALADGLLG
jgi:DNA phosphorothioation-dependent restriction protein DptH